MWLRVLCHQLFLSLSLAPQLLVSQDSGMASYHLVMFFFSFSTPLVCDSSHFILSLFVSLAIHLVTVVEFVLIRVIHHLSCSLFECLKCSTSWLFQGYWQWRFFVIPTPTVWLSPIGARLFCLGALSAVSVWDVATWGACRSFSMGICSPPALWNFKVLTVTWNDTVLKLGTVFIYLFCKLLCCCCSELLQNLLVRWLLWLVRIAGVLEYCSQSISVLPAKWGSGICTQD